MGQPLLISIIINNYNYGRFLSQAIDSALLQAYRPTEVIVVDDGSTDNSVSIIAGYRDRVVPIIKKNGGQASAFNAGFSRSSGEVILFLDADDTLLPGIAERVAAIFYAKPETAKVQFRLEVIDASGKRTGMVKPPWSQPMPCGDLRPQVLAFPDDISWQPTSGNAFSATVLRRIFPVPEDTYRICADYYLSNLPPLFGEVISLDEVGGYYRVHGANNHHMSELNLEHTRQIITRTCRTHRFIKSTADSLGLTTFPDDTTDVLSVTFLAHRMVSMKLDPGHHPLARDSLWSLFVGGLRASFGRFDLSWSARLLYAHWFAAVLFAPKPMVRWLAQKFFYAETRGRLGSFVDTFRR